MKIGKLSLSKLTGLKNFSAVLLFCAAAAIASPAQVFTTLVEFDGTNGDGPEWGTALVQGFDGNLYGTSPSGSSTGTPYGTVFKMTPSGTLTTLHVFTTYTDGEVPFGGIVQGSNGKFYGATVEGGWGGRGCPHGCGTIYRITPNGNFTALHQFHSSEGGVPYDGPVQGVDGNFYGTTENGGSTTICKSTIMPPGCGVVYKMTPAGALTALHVFCLQTGCADGERPYAPLVQASSGVFYGTADGGGTNVCACGTVFQITSAGEFATLHNFDGTDGENPSTALIQGNDGQLYGTTSRGGAYNYGTLFRLMLSGQLTTLHNFNSTDGASPNVLMQATDGNFYGTTASGGANNYGTIFQMTLAGVLTTLHDFDGTDGQNPRVGLLQSTSGKLYGATGAGGLPDCYGMGCGTIFSLDMGLGPFVAFGMKGGRVGQMAEILGQGFSGTTSVLFNGSSATFKVQSDTFLTATVPSGATSGWVTVTTPSGTLKSNVPFRVIQ